MSMPIFARPNIPFNGTTDGAGNIDTTDWHEVTVGSSGYDYNTLEGAISSIDDSGTIIKIMDSDISINSILLQGRKNIKITSGSSALTKIQTAAHTNIIYIGMCENIILENLNITAENPITSGAGAFIWDSSHVVLKDMKIILNLATTDNNNDDIIDFMFSKYCTVDNVDLIGCTASETEPKDILRAIGTSQESDFIKISNLTLPNTSDGWNVALISYPDLNSEPTNINIDFEYFVSYYASNSRHNILAFASEAEALKFAKDHPMLGGRNIESIMYKDGFIVTSVETWKGALQFLSHPDRTTDSTLGHTINHKGTFDASDLELYVNTNGQTEFEFKANYDNSKINFEFNSYTPAITFTSLDEAICSSNSINLINNKITLTSGNKLGTTEIIVADNAFGKLGTFNVTVKQVTPPTQYTVTFDSKGGTSVPSQKVDTGQKIVKPPDPTKNGYKFLGWLRPNGNLWNFNNATVTRDITLTADWEAIEYTVTFDADGGTPIPDIQTKKYDEKITKPTDPTKDGFNFLGWFDGSNEWNFATGVVTKDISLKAKWKPQATGTKFTVTFDSDGGTPTPINQILNLNDRVTEPTAPIKSGFNFLGWYDGNTKWDFNKAVIADVVLKAKWEAVDAEYSISGSLSEAGARTIAYTVDGISKNITTGSDGKFTISGIQQGQTVNITPPAISGYTVSPTSLNYSNVVKDHTDANFIYTKRDANTYIVNFFTESNASNPYRTISVASGGKAIRPTEPTKYGYTFIGWYLSNGTRWNFDNDIVTSNVNLYAKWAQNVDTYTISGSLNINGIRTINYTVDGRSYTVDTDSYGNYAITGIIRNQKVVVTPPYVWGYSVYPDYLDLGNITSSRTNINFYYTWSNYNESSGDSSSSDGGSTWTPSTSPSPSPSPSPTTTTSASKTPTLTPSPSTTNLGIEEIPKGTPKPVLNKPYIFGFEDGLLRPNGSLSRAQLAQILYNLYFDDESFNMNHGFPDVKAGDWYNKAVAFAKACNYMVGDGKFRPNDPVTRAEFCTVFANVKQLTGRKTMPFGDVVGHWGLISMEKIFAVGAISGFPDDNTFRPNDPITRAQVCTIINKLEDYEKIYDTNKTFPDLLDSHWAFIDMMIAANGHTK